MTDEELRPLELGKILDKTLKLTISSIKSSFLLYIIYLIAGGLTYMLSAFIISSLAPVSFWDVLFGNYYNFPERNRQLFMYIINGVNFIVDTLKVPILALILDSAISLYLKKEWNFKEAFSRIKKKIPTLLIVGAMASLFTLVGVLGCGIGIVVTSLLVIFYIPVIIYEDHGIREALKRSKKLVNYSYWGMLGTYILGAITISILVFFLTIGLLISQRALGSTPGGLPTIINDFNNIAGNITDYTSLFLRSLIFLLILLFRIVLTTGLFISFCTVLFFNQKVKYENYGMERMAEVFAEGTAIVDSGSDEPPQDYI